eukprot:2327548-Pyramimonas_sp.AAC.1
MELPEELWQRVLYRLPARTLLRARAVCRQVKPRVPEIPVNSMLHSSFMELKTVPIANDITSL